MEGLGVSKGKSALNFDIVSCIKGEEEMRKWYINTSIGRFRICEDICRL